MRSTRTILRPNRLHRNRLMRILRQMRTARCLRPKYSSPPTRKKIR